MRIFKGVGRGKRGDGSGKYEVRRKCGSPRYHHCEPAESIRSEDVYMKQSECRVDYQKLLRHCLSLS
ncbi:hypothetical protein [Roseivirga sp.]|uniref:hypothetical protein n=1 Tax=Roseivirga sp. TaxID=1964215 RepID=UPI002B27590F|nr:hypothetical protein [Roseivirga sp.]